MKHLVFVNGTMGVGKTTVCQQLKSMLTHCVFLDGDWCWDMNPFMVTPETKEMVLENISTLLSNFLRCSVYETVLFCWVMQEEEIIKEILRRITAGYDRLSCFTLNCSKEELIRRLEKDIREGKRDEETIERSLERRSLYEKMETIHLDVTGITAQEAARWMLAKINQ
ncbi:AAA family ATPase [Massiliimalia timonensis]|uniref:AAA family ATPase n=1 Tax=Massiliimalia timonensis TaxID=1987501 RepID=UPI00189D7BFE|nr:AAA family ATPase [Massiliimalia timonensis]